MIRVVYGAVVPSSALGRAGDEVLLLLVAERRQLVPGVPQRVAVDPLGWLAQLRDRDRRAARVERLPGPASMPRATVRLSSTAAVRVLPMQM